MKLPRHEFPGAVPGGFRRGAEPAIFLMGDDVELTHNSRQHRGSMRQKAHGSLGAVDCGPGPVTEKLDPGGGQGRAISKLPGFERAGLEKLRRPSYTGVVAKNSLN